MNSESDKKDETLQFRLSRFDAQIKLEFDLIGHRMSWLMTSQAFLFAAFAVSVTAGTPRVLLLAQWLQFLIPALGATTTALVGLAINAAHDVIKSLKVPREGLEDQASKAGYEKLGVGIESPNHQFGNYPSRFLPPVLFAVWMVLLAVSIWGLLIAC